MNTLIQQTSKLVGDYEACIKLAAQDTANLLIISDSHGARRLLHQILKSFGPAADALLFCGDGASDVIFCLEEAVTDESFRETIPPVTAFVQGNGDASTYAAPYTAAGFSVPSELMLKAAGGNIFLTHGHRYDVYYGYDSLIAAGKTHGSDLICFGHTHIVHQERKKGIQILNPGSCYRPRAGLPPTFATARISKKGQSIDLHFYEIQEDEKTEYRFIPYIR
jgi:uncharacterized protein